MTIRICFSLFLILFSAQTLFADQNSSHPFGIKCGTFAPPEEMNQFVSSIATSEYNRPVLQHKYEVPGGKFLIHYDTNGNNAVDLVDNNKNNIPDYIDSVAFYANFTYKSEVEEMGYLSPVPDGESKDGRYDIYLVELGKSKSWYGYTSTTTTLPSTTFPRYHSYLVMDNDFSIKDSVGVGSSRRRVYTTTGYQGMKITLVHEFHHAIQFLYGRHDASVRTIAEMTSTWMEYKHFPHIKDYYQYVKAMFKNQDNLRKYTFGVNNPEAGYCYSIFAQFISKEYDEKIIKRTWELVKTTTINTYAALDSAFKESNSSLAQAWKEFMPWMYHTGSRSINNKYLSDSKELAEYSFPDQDTLKANDMIHSRELKPFEISTKRVYRRRGAKSIFITDMFISNIDVKTGLSGFFYSKKFTSIVSNNLKSGYTELDNLGVFHKFESEDDKCIEVLFLNKTEDNISHAYPNPLNLDMGSNINFPVPNEMNLYSEATINVYTPDMIPVFSVTKQIIINGEHKVVQVNVENKNLSSGVYVFEVVNDDHSSIGKFAVID